MKIQLINNRPQFDAKGNELNFAISANSAPQGLVSSPVINSLSGGPIQYNISYPFSVFEGSNDITISMDFIDSGRIYFGYDTLPTNVAGVIAPIPDGNQYYGWVELSRKAADMCVWINLSNVDIVGMPLTLSGSSGWSLGYKNSVNDLINDISTAFPGAVVTGETRSRIVGPDIRPGAYTSFDTYFNKLSNAGAKLCINSDTLSSGNQEVFTGGFSKSKGAITMHSCSGNEIVIFYTAITSDIIYKGDGATLYLNGVEYPENRPGKSDSVIMTNSVFRNIIIGLNEGYFEISPKYSKGVNYSVNYSYLKPFGKSGNIGNMYAKMVHDCSNSYGFPYADSNLKTLIQAPLTDLITLTVIGDNVSGYCYQNNEVSTQNSPGYGYNQLGIGCCSNTLGNINIGNCNYPATTDIAGAGGFLPYVTQYVPMIFNGAGGKYIWIKPSTLDFSAVDAYGNSCFIYPGGAAAPPIITYISGATGSVIGQKLTWGANVSWNPAAGSAVKPK
jgi:hypothetical protein